MKLLKKKSQSVTDLWQHIRVPLPIWLKADRPHGRLLFSPLVGTDDIVPLFQRAVIQPLYTILQDEHYQVMPFFSGSTNPATIP